MNWLRCKRMIQVIRYGWSDAKAISKDSGRSAVCEYINLLLYFRRFYVFSNQYKKCLWALDDKETLALKIGKQNLKRDNWIIDKYENRRFIQKWSSQKWDVGHNRPKKRQQAYTKQFNAGTNLIVQHNVDIHREHYLEGTIKIGNNVLLAKNVFIDYSGEITIQDDVALANGVIIETHTHLLEKKGAPPDPGHLVIEEGVKVLSRAYIADTCHKIGRYARIGAGTYVRSNVPPYAIMMGNPAKIIGFLYSPEEMVEFEKEKYDETNRTPLEQYRKDYEKYFLSRRAEIKNFIRK